MKEPLGSPPHVRVIHNIQYCISYRIGITPACAGNTMVEEETIDGI